MAVAVETRLLLACVAIYLCIIYTIFTFVEFVFDIIPYGQLITKIGFAFWLVSGMVISFPTCEQLIRVCQRHHPKH